MGRTKAAARARERTRREQEIRQRLPEIAPAPRIFGDQSRNELHDSPQFPGRFLTALRAEFTRRRRAAVQAGNGAVG